MTTSKAFIESQPAESTPAAPLLHPAERSRIPVHVFASPRLPLSPTEIRRLEQIARLPNVRQVVALPDLHVKPRLEAPSSLAAAVQDHLILGLSSPSPNCGMALAVTGFHQENLNRDGVDALFARLAQRLPLAPTNPFISESELVEMLLRGAGAAVDHFGLDRETLSFMDQAGNAIENRTSTGLLEDVLAAVPNALLDVGRRFFGQVGRGNHFLELQVIEKIHDPHTARAWGIEKGQLVWMYHADSGYLGAFTGRAYAHRLKNTWRGRLYEWQLKLPFQWRAGKASRIFHRARYHLLPRPLAQVPVNSEEGQRTLLALQAASNYAYANRIAILSAIRDTAAEILGPQAETRLLWDAPHNSIRREALQDGDLWIHRHNAAHVLPPSQIEPESPFAGTGHPVLLPGTERSRSYLLASGEGASFALNSADHGAGGSVAKLAQPLPGAQATLIYGASGGLVEKRAQVSAAGLDEVLDVLHTYNIAHPVAELKPLAVLKQALP